MRDLLRVKFKGYYLAYVMQGLILITTLYSIYLGLYSVTFTGLVALGLTTLPYLVHRKVHIVVPWEITFLIAFALFLHIAGYSFEWYLNFYPYYDKVAHLVSSITIALLGFLSVLVLMKISRCLQFEPWQIFLFIVIFTVALGAIWEIWEFTLDTLFPAYLIKPLQQGLADTMIDMIFDLAGGLLVAVLGTLYLKRKGADAITNSLIEPGYDIIIPGVKRE